MKLYRIGEISKLYGISVDSLRHYEKLGLLEPEYVKDNGYRYYSNRQIWKLNTIRSLRQLDIGLPEIQRYLTNRTLEKNVDLIEFQLDAIAKKREALAKIEKQLMQSQQYILKTLSTRNEINMEIKTLPERRAWGIEEKVTSFWDIDRLHKEIEVDKFGGELTAAGTGRAGAVIPMTDFTQGEFFIYRMTFILDDEGDKVLQGGDHLCLHFWGHDDHAEIALKYQEVLAYCDAQHLQIIGPAVELYKLDNHQTDDPTEFLTELQVPVARKAIA
ncbi:MerR family transcriptional regulator [Thaumasiovibrio subtropicus]|uniref:MerR family transcriptional regulator n=1 Tax=Thaumasiovibrio subtropicus TaxID=1891207 RepID=UPI000B35D84A|nr:MerR family transcriptional regulator [Thaumasiovibrio subtropicus]